MQLAASKSAVASGVAAHGRQCRVLRRLRKRRSSGSVAAAPAWRERHGVRRPFMIMGCCQET